MPTLTVTPTVTPATLAAAAIGMNVSLVGGSAAYSGTAAPIPAGTYAASGTALRDYFYPLWGLPYEIDSGALITTGRAQDAAGINIAQDTGRDLGIPGESGDTTQLSFHFIPTYPVLVIPLVMASDEYTEFVGTPFNDTFSVKLNGVEVGYLPDRVTAISINNVNLTSHPTYYSDNPPGGSQSVVSWIVYDGFIPINLLLFVTPGSNYTLTIQVADVGDGFYDSAIFLGELRTYPPMYATPIGSTPDGTPLEDITDIPALVHALFPQIPPSSLSTITAALVAEAIAAGATLSPLPRDTPPQWRLHKFDMKHRREERA